MGLQIISPGDCKRISLSIEKATGKLISETTLKRFFGFAKQKYSFSKYTLNVICEYAGFESWDRFNDVLLTGQNLNEEDTLWDSLKRKSGASVALLSLQNLSGIPFSATVSRFSAEADFDYFLRSNYQLFCLTGPAGIGKSIQIAHLVSKFFTDKEAPFHSSLVWLQKARDYNGNSPFLVKDVEGKLYSLEKLINILSHFESHPKEVESKMVLIYDGFDNDVFDIETLDRFFRQISELLSYAKDFTWFKIVISLRAASWLLLQTKIDQSDYLKAIWFSGFFYRKELRCNLFPLSRKVVDHVIKNICAETKINSADLFLNEKVYELLGHPAYMYIYYSFLKGGSPYSRRGDALYCELIISFVARKIHQAHHGLEKIWLIRKFLKATDYGRAGSFTNRNVLFEPDEILIAAYNELVSDGIFQEEYTENPFNYQVTVRLMEPVFYYFIATELLKNKEEDDTVKFVQSIRDDYPADKFNMIILWVLISHAVKQQGTLLSIVYQEGWPVSEKENYILFIIDLIANSPDIISIKDKEEFVKKSIHFLSFNLFSIDWTKGLQARLGILLTYAPDEEEHSHLLILLAIEAILQLNMEGLSTCINMLKQIDRKLLDQIYPVYPVEQLECIHEYYLSGFIDRKFIQHTDNPFNHSVCLPHDQSHCIGKILSLRLAFFVTMLQENGKPGIALSNILIQEYAEWPLADNHSDMLYCWQLREVAILLQNNMHLEAKELMEHISSYCERQNMESGHSLFNYMYRMIQINLALSHNELEKADKILLKIYKDVLSTDYRLLQMFTAVALIRVYNRQKKFEAAAHIIKDIQVIVSEAADSIERWAYTLINRA